MTALRFTKFLGYAPKSAPELLADTGAQVAVNVKFYSGDLLPYRTPTVIGNVGRNGVLRTIYPMRNPANPADLKWLSWLSDVDVASVVAIDNDEQRIYYTGDGVPKVTNYALATSGSLPYPTNSYDLGLPLPDAAPVASGSAFTTLNTVSYSRSGNVATIVTASAHGLKTGYYVSVSDFVSTDGATFNTASAQVTVLSSTSFSYFSVGSTMSASDSNGRVTLAGNALARNYVYTYITPWGEESVPSPPSETIYVREGQVVTVTSLPSTPPAGNYNIRGIRLYRTVTGTSGTIYMRLRTLWFPQNPTQASRTSNLVTMTTPYEHNLLAGDEIRTTLVAFGGVPDTSFNVSDVAVQDVIDDYTFTYLATGSDKALTALTAGLLEFDAAEPEITSSRFFTSSGSFIDDFNVAGLAITLDSLDADAPDPEMQGLIAVQNNMLAGFVGNQICFSDINRPWSWPIKYRLTLEYPIVALAAVGGQIAALTTKFVYRVSGSSPSSMSYDRADAPYPCLSKRGVLNVGYGVVFPSYGGLAVFQSGGGLSFVTRIVHDWDTWPVLLDPSTLTSAFYAGKYFGSHSSGSFIFEQDEKTGGFFSDAGITFSAAFYDAVSNRFYYIPDTSGTLAEWDAVGQPLLPMEWKSKVLITKGYMNFGAARVVGDYSTPAADADAVATYNATVAPFNQEIWDQISELGTVNGPSPLDYVHPVSGSPLSVSGAVNSFPINGDPFTIDLLQLTGVYPVNFKLWANKVLVLDTTIQNSDVFRLPTGYRTDTLEFSVSGSARIKSIHIGDTPYSLRDA